MNPNKNKHMKYTYINRLLIAFVLTIGTLLNGQSQVFYQQVTTPIGINDLYSSELESAAHALADSMETPSFRVLSYEIYPTLSFVNSDEGYNRALEIVKAELAGRTDPYLAIIKRIEVDRIEGGAKKLAYNVQLKLPNTQVYNNIDGIEVYGLESFVLESIENEYEKYGSNISAELEGINTFWNQLKILKDGGTLDNGLERANFRKVYYPSSLDDIVATGIDSLSGNVYDYAGIKNEGTFIRNAVVDGYSNLGFDAPAVIITSSMVTKEEINAAKLKYNELPNKLILWLHFDITNSGNSLNYRTRNNYSIQEATEILDEEYTEALRSYYETIPTEDTPPLAYKRGENEGSNSRSGEPFNCDGSGSGPVIDCDPPFILDFSAIYDYSKQWRAYCCIVKGIDLNNPTPDLITGINNFQTGVGCGVADGLIETASFALDIASGLTTALEHTPNLINPLMYAEIYKQIRKENSFIRGVKKKFEGDIIYWKNLANTAWIIYETGYQIFAQVWLAIEAYFDALDPRSGLASTGWAVGKVGFEVILGVFTGGSSAVKFTAKMSSLIKMVGEEGLDGIRNFVYKGLADASDKVKRAKFKNLIRSKGGKLVDNLNLGNYVRNVGDYKIYKNGEVFYRAMNKADVDYFKNNEIIRVPLDNQTSEMFTSPTLSYVESSSYLEGTVIVKFKLKPGTLDEFVINGVRNDGSFKMMQNFPELPQSSGGWMENSAMFKTEKGQINIGLGRDGYAMNKFNENIIEFQIIE